MHKPYVLHQPICVSLMCCTHAVLQLGMWHTWDTLKISVFSAIRVGKKSICVYDPYLCYSKTILDAHHAQGKSVRTQAWRSIVNLVFKFNWQKLSKMIKGTEVKFFMKYGIKESSYCTVNFAPARIKWCKKLDWVISFVINSRASKTPKLFWAKVIHRLFIPWAHKQLLMLAEANHANKWTLLPPNSDGSLNKTRYP